MIRRTGREVSAEEYRGLVRAGPFSHYRIVMEQTDIFISSHGEFRSEAVAAIRRARLQVLRAIDATPLFHDSLRPIPGWKNAPEVVQNMLRASSRAAVGPMAAVAGSIAEAVGRALLQYSPEVVVENAGDAFVRTNAPQRIGILAESSRTGRVHIRVGETRPGKGIGVCTSSGRLGHSFSFGKADAATIVAEDTALADALATATANRIKTREDITPALAWAMEHGALGALVIAFDAVGVRGNIQLDD